MNPGYRASSIDVAWITSFIPLFYLVFFSFFFPEFTATHSNSLITSTLALSGENLHVLLCSMFKQD